MGTSIMGTLIIALRAACSTGAPGGTGDPGGAKLGIVILGIAK